MSDSYINKQQRNVSMEERMRRIRYPRTDLELTQRAIDICKKEANKLMRTAPTDKPPSS
jgi:hypothetical protein